MDLQTVTYLVVGASFALYIGIAIWARAGSTSEFYAAGGSVHPITNGMATAADWMSAASFIGLAGTLYFSGFEGLAFVTGWTGGFVLVALLLAPITPHICHELWQRLGHADAVIDAQWPQVDESALVQDSLTLVVQVNGKLRGEIIVAASASREDVEAAARANENVLRFTEGLTIRKVIVVPGKLVNIVAN